MIIKRNNIDLCKNDVIIIKDGQKINKNDYYSDFHTNNIYQEKTNYNISNEIVDQVDPSSFFNNSMNSVINQIKTI